MFFSVKNKSKTTKRPAMLFVEENASKRFDTEKDFIVRESGRGEHVHKAKSAQEAIAKHNKSVGFDGGVVTVALL